MSLLLTEKKVFNQHCPRQVHSPIPSYMKYLSDHLQSSYCTHSRIIAISSLKSGTHSCSIEPALAIPLNKHGKLAITDEVEQNILNNIRSSANGYLYCPVKKTVN